MTVIIVLCVSLAIASASQNDLATGWLPPAVSGVEVKATGDNAWEIASSTKGEFTLESARAFDARVGDSFAVNLRLKVDLNIRALPELVCYDAAGREIPHRSALATGPGVTTTDWQLLRRIFPALPGTARVRARLRASGRGQLEAAGLEFSPVKVDAYQSGALITQPHPKLRAGVVLESNHGIVNADLLTGEDRDGDGKWALINIDLDRLTQPERKGVDWRTSFEDNPNEILWSDGAVLKSDTVSADREPDLNKALHFRMRVHAGSYGALVSDPGRSVAVSRDGRTWRRHEGGSEIELGRFEAQDGVIEFWLDACYRDPVTAGPVYFDYVRLIPIDDEVAIERLFNAARRTPGKLSRGSVEEKRVEVTVNAPSFSEGVNWPVRCGLPVPQGELASAENVAVLNAAGEKIPSQQRAMAVWPDGSVKWLHLDFMHDLARGGTGRYTVVYGNRVRSVLPPTAVRVQSTVDGVEVDTGALRFVVPRSRFGLLENVRRASGVAVQREPVTVEIVEAGGKIWRALELPVEKIEIEQAGPLHAVILIETKLAESGQPASGFFHRARLHAYAGSPLVQVDYFVANTDSRPAGEVEGSMSSRVAVKSIALKLRPAEAITGASHELGRAPASGAIVQKNEEAVLLNSGAGDRESRGRLRGRLPGWIALALQGGGNLSAGVAEFREQFPKALRWNERELEITLWAAEGGEFDWIEGVGKTHHLALFYGNAQPAEAELLAAGPVLALAAPEWYTGSGAFGPQITAAASGLPAVEQTLASHIRERVIEHVGLGFEHYGDHSSGGYVKGTFLWDNNEYDLPAGAMVHFARTGDRDALRIGLAGALHYLDVDTIHYSSQHADWARAPHTHSHATFGHHTAEGPGFHHAGYVQGLLWYSYFTGEPAGLSGARGIADWVLRNQRTPVFQMERALGHPLMTLNDVYEATWDEAYLRGAARLVERSLKWEHPARSGFLAPITEWPAYYSGSPFCGGLLTAALLKFNGWARLPEIDRMLERVAQWTLTDVWRPAAGLESKGGSPRGKPDAKHIASHLRLLADVFARTGDPFFLAVPRLSLIEGFGENAQPFGTRSTGLVFNYLPWMLATLKAQGDPATEPQLNAQADHDEIILGRGGKARVCFTLSNRSESAISDLRVSFRARLDLKTTPVRTAPAALSPGQSVNLCYEIQAPEQVNLTSEYNRIAYGHWSALYRRAGKSHLAHRWIKITLAENEQPGRKVVVR